MFANCTSLASLDLSGWDVSEDAEFFGTFSGCTSLSAVTLGAGGGKLAAAVDEGAGGSWCGPDGKVYAALAEAFAAAAKLPVIFTKATLAASGEGQALSFASLDADVVAEAGDATAESGQAKGDSDEGWANGIGAASDDEQPSDQGQAAEGDASADADQTSGSGQPAEGGAAPGSDVPADGDDASTDSDASTDGDDASADGDQPADSDTTADGDASQEQPAEQEQPSDPELSDSTDAAGSVEADQDQQSAVAPPEEDVAGDAAPTPDPDGQPVGQADADVPAESASDLEPATVEESAGQAA